MKAGDFSGSAGRLHDAWRVLRDVWQDTADEWHDVRRREFQEQFIEPLGPLVIDALQRMNTLAQVFVQVREECTERE